MRTLGTIGGFKLFIEDRADLGYDALFHNIQTLIGKGYQTPGLAGVFSTFTVNVPQLDADIDRVKAKQQGVPLQNLFETMQVYLGSLYVNDFNRFGRTFQVIAQADAQFRERPEDITRLKTRNVQGQMDCRLPPSPSNICVGMPSFTENTPPGDQSMTQQQAEDIADFLLEQK